MVDLECDPAAECDAVRGLVAEAELALDLFAPAATCLFEVAVFFLAVVTFFFVLVALPLAVELVAETCASPGRGQAHAHITPSAHPVLSHLRIFA